MHFIKKTPATEVELAAKVKKREEKLQQYIGNFTNSTINDKEGNEKELSIEEKKAKFVNDLFDQELDLTKEALYSNPKSYSAWNHRFWSFSNHPNGDVKKELELCKKALSYDCRNFHCWDHRRSISKLANLTNKDELQFSDQLIKANPSNYSAWHYRATLLPKVCPDDEINEFKMPISINCLREEYETKNVCCYNSEDQTAWTYCRWLSEIARSYNYRPEAKEVLVDLVSFCTEMVKIDPEIPWSYIMLARSKIFLNGRTNECLQEVEDLTNKIKELDPQRKNLYTDLLEKKQTKEC